MAGLRGGGRPATRPPSCMPGSARPTRRSNRSTGPARCATRTSSSSPSTRSGTGGGTIRGSQRCSRAAGSPSAAEALPGAARRAAEGWRSPPAWSAVRASSARVAGTPKADRRGLGRRARLAPPQNAGATARSERASSPLLRRTRRSRRGDRGRRGRGGCPRRRIRGPGRCGNPARPSRRATVVSDSTLRARRRVGISRYSSTDSWNSPARMCPPALNTPSAASCKPRSTAHCNITSR